MQPTGGARAKARSAGWSVQRTRHNSVFRPCEPASRGKGWSSSDTAVQCGAALRGHACDDISRISSAYRFQRR